ncbi:unnamed protein product [Closterium sp. Naga37s-1]|nr:unnamed protein product [Closterium sp. Naga37s-1]
MIAATRVAHPHSRVPLSLLVCLSVAALALSPRALAFTPSAVLNYRGLVWRLLDQWQSSDLTAKSSPSASVFASGNETQEETSEASQDSGGNATWGFFEQSQDSARTTWEARDVSKTTRGESTGGELAATSDAEGAESDRAVGMSSGWRKWRGHVAREERPLGQRRQMADSWLDGVNTPIVVHRGSVGAIVRNNYVHDFIFAFISVLYSPAPPPSNPPGVNTPIVVHRGAVGVIVRNNYVHDFIFAGIRCGSDAHYAGDCMLTQIDRNLVVAAGRNRSGDQDAAGIYFCVHWFSPALVMYARTSNGCMLMRIDRNHEVTSGRREEIR